jgi:predicted signal transduction protein with EAL and GGDEF domain
VFIPIAEEIGLVPEVTRAMLAVTLRDLGALLREHRQLSIKKACGEEKACGQEKACCEKENDSAKKTCRLTS